jgi:two-component system, LytTR family, sensor kinase
MNRWFELNGTDGLAFLLIYPAVIEANNSFFGPANLMDKALFVESMIINLSAATTPFLGDMAWTNCIRFRFGGTDPFVQQALYARLGLAVITIGMVLLLFWLYDCQELPCTHDPLPGIILIGFAANSISAGILEAIFTYGQSRQSTQGEIELKRLPMQQQMDMLKPQMNSHVLFNSLNPLIALIGEPPAGRTLRRGTQLRLPLHLTIERAESNAAGY